MPHLSTQKTPKLKNMIAALYNSRERGLKDFTRDGKQFGWATVQKIFSEELARAEEGRSRKVPGLKYAYVYRDNWTRLNVRPAKIMQQRFMITAIQDLADETNDDKAKWTGKYFSACNLFFERRLLSHCRINSLNSQVLSNLRKRMAFFEEWCYSHDQTVCPQNAKRQRQKRFLAWQVIKECQRPVNLKC